jgi:aldehyde dehydrogenase (NAD+)
MITDFTIYQFIFKFSEKLSLGALAMRKLVVETDFFPGVINFVSRRAKTGQLLAMHMGINKISFTRSAEAGRRV